MTLLSHLEMMMMMMMMVMVMVTVTVMVMMMMMMMKRNSMIQWNRAIPLQIMIQLQRKKVFHKL